MRISPGSAFHDLICGFCSEGPFVGRLIWDAPMYARAPGPHLSDTVQVSLVLGPSGPGSAPSICKALSPEGKGWLEVPGLPHSKTALRSTTARLDQGPGVGGKSQKLQAGWWSERVAALGLVVRRPREALCRLKQLFCLSAGAVAPVLFLHLSAWCHKSRSL